MPSDNEFRDWMDTNGLRAEQIAPKFGVSTQTISHWRSQGVPDRRAAHVKYIMASWPEAGIEPPAKMDQPLVIHASRDRFRRWNQAALAEGMLVEDWAVKGLDELAAEWQPGLRTLPPAPQAEDDPRPHGARLNDGK